MLLAKNSVPFEGLYSSSIAPPPVGTAGCRPMYVPSPHVESQFYIMASYSVLHTQV